MNQDTIIREAEETITEILSSIQSATTSNWVQKKNSDTFSLWINKENDVRTSISKTYIDLSPEVMMSHSCDSDLTRQLDSLIEEEHVLNQLSDHLCIQHIIYKGKYMISGRDFYVYRYWQVLEEGKYILCWWDVPHNTYPSPPGKIRGNMMSAYIFEQDIDQNRCIATMVAQTKLNGNIPNWVQDIINEDIPYHLERLGKILKSRKDIDFHITINNNSKLFI
ncbi:hypothetical protein WA158_008530 [Blastocystis sp. Blastoise]